MNLRFATNLVHLLLAGVVLVACFAFAPGVVAWLGLGFGVLAVSVSLIGFALTERGAAQRVLDLVVAVAGAWLIVASRTFAAGTAQWLVFADAALIATLATIGLIAHERRAAASSASAETDAAPSAGALAAPARANGRTPEPGFHPHPVAAGTREP